MAGLGAAALLVLLSVAPSPSASLATFAARSDNDANLIANAVLAAPTLLSAALRPDGSTVDLSWRPSASTFATGYRVYRGPSSAGPFAPVVQVAGGSIQTSSDVPGPGGFFYAVRAYYGSTWESANSAVVGPIRPLDHFSIAPVAPQHSGVGFAIAVSARASDGSLVTAFNGSVRYTADDGAISPAMSAPFSGGVSSQTITVTGPYTAAERVSVVDTAHGRTGASDPFSLEHFRPLAIASRNKQGGTAGLVEDGDTIAITFSEPADPSTFGDCVTHDTGNDLVIAHGAGSDTLRASGPALTLGTVDLGARDYFRASGVATASLCAWDAGYTVLTVTLMSVSGATAVAASTITFVPSATLASAAGERVDTTQRAEAAGQQF